VRLAFGPVLKNGAQYKQFFLACHHFVSYVWQTLLKKCEFADLLSSFVQFNTFYDHQGCAS
jgi:hypothetical protein